tara:strand:- start:212 stop:481 length:270 start_codon:yes stop_codon:yes gene_type:complete
MSDDKSLVAIYQSHIRQAPTPEDQSSITKAALKMIRHNEEKVRLSRGPSPTARTMDDIARLHELHKQTEALKVAVAKNIMNRNPRLFRK